MNHILQKAHDNLRAIKDSKPLIHNITNYVVMNFTANTLLAMGASPVMAHAPNEVEQMVSFSQSLVLNIGTLSDDWVNSMISAGKKAAACNIPIILDPVGSGATLLRTESAKKIIAEAGVTVVRGNSSEILSLTTTRSKTKGVDSIHSVDDAEMAAHTISSDLSATVAVTGSVDIVTDGNRTIKIHNGHPLLTSITGTGCAASATIGAFLAVDDDPITATASALAFFGYAGEVAATKASAPGSFMIHLLDALYTITPQDLLTCGKIQEVSCVHQ